MQICGLRQIYNELSKRGKERYCNEDGEKESNEDMTKEGGAPVIRHGML